MSEGGTKPRRRGRLTAERERALRPSPPVDWRQWWQQLGHQHREMREFLGFSQEQLARLAGVSQGAVSRLEAGKGLGTPLLVILKIGLVIHRALRGVDASLLKEDLRRFLELESRLSPPVNGTGVELLPIAQEPDLNDIIRLYRAIPERNRDTFLAVVRAVAQSLTGRDGSDG